MKPQLPDRDDLQGPRDENSKDVSDASTRFAEFEAWMDRDLENLVARWSAWAAPNALRGGRKAALRQ